MASFPWLHPYGGYQRPLIPPDPNEAIREISQLEKAAERTTDIDRIIDLYQYALSICDSQNFTHRAATIHCKRADIELRHGYRYLQEAIHDADDSIEKDPDYLMGYHLSGLARQMFWRTYRQHPLAQTYVALAVQHFVTYYQKTSPQKKSTARGDLCTAIILAVDSGNSAILNLKETINKDATECTATVLELVSMKTCSCNHLQFVIVKGRRRGSGIAQELGCNLSKLDASKLFEKSDIDLQTLQAVIKLGAIISFNSIEKAIKHITDDKRLVLESAVTACDPKLEGEALTSLCNQALNLNKPILSAFLISQGANPDSESMIRAVDTKNPSEGLVSHLLSTPDGTVCLFKHSLSKSSLTLVQKCLDGGYSSTLSQTINLGDFLKSSKDLLCQNPDLFDALLKTDVNPNGLSDSNKPIDALLALPKDLPQKIRLVSTLIEYGADLTKATYPRAQGTTIFHMATELAIQKDDPQIMETVCSHYKFPEDFEDKVQATNKEGQTPYHLIMQRKQNDVTVKLCEILSNCPINPSLPDSRGKRPADFKSQKYKGDKRVPILMKKAQDFQAVQSRRRAAKSSASKSAAKKGGGKSSQKKGAHNEDNDIMHAEDVIQDSFLALEMGASPETTTNKMLSKSSPLIEDSNIQALKEFIQFLSEKSTQYFSFSIHFARQSSSQKGKLKLVQLKNESIDQASPQPVQPLSDKQHGLEHEADKEDLDLDINKDNLLANFDDESLKWEVEFPENVVKYFKGKSSDKILCLAIKKIQRLASGIPTNNPKLCKRVRGSEEIYETRVTKAVRILWEVATQFSPTLTSKLRCSDKLQGVADKGSDYYLYSEVIRIWDIVEDHDNLNRSIDLAVKRIKSCRERGEQASTKECLLPSGGNHTSAGHSDDIRYPQVFTNRQLDEKARERIANQVFCCPAGSAKDDEYNVITFYPFDFSFVKSILEGEDARRDFPYKEWPKEHDIINMKRRSILLLGRSGTGKTTCCLYRLWNCFQNYWSKANDAGPLLDACPLTFYDVENNEDSDSEDETAESSLSESHTDQCKPTEDLSDAHDSADESQTESSTDLEHLHQVFITKNYVLCAQMKKRFYDLAAGSDIAKEHMPFEEAERPTSFSKLADLAYPLFLTAREFFLLLDNSLNDGKEFFTRTPDGKLTEKIRSSDYDHEDPDTLLDLDWESDQEEGSESESSDDEAANPQSEAKVKQPQRREVTASYFVEKIWPHIHHICEDKKTDPLLIWMEIKSFIKGSRKAVESVEGYLTQEGYVNVLGKKMAANFAGNREEVYEVFKKYQNFIKHKAEESLFDECEFIHNLFGRLCKLKEVPFSIHSFYVDEVQDFTQAELSILLRCCKDPNDLFLTGDTAQSIMRGVSFRFSDLRSLFHKAKKQAKNIHKKAMVTVPIVDELTINFRSHSGVLRLAASVIEVLQKFFPNSFDRLPGDIGMFPGPIPTLLDSCNFSDLALVLRGNKRESSAIEFGAHQVIIVQSEDAKRALPSELQAGIALTVFEAKGLEFDDVLLYNFFTDSKVSKEWRIVTEFIENTPKLLAPEAFNKGFEDKPRPLKFDEQHHKSLSAELKYLYTAITRAKCNLWIYDSDEKKRLPMFDYWNRRGLVKIIRLSEISQQDESVLFTATSTKEEWKKQGDYFKKKKLWEPAMKCYVKAEEKYLEKEAKAYCLVQQARAPNLKPREMEQLYLQAALAFLECDKSKHDVKSLRYAASFLKKAKRPNEAGLLYAKLSRHKDAVREFKKSKNFKGLVLLKEQEGNYNDAVCLLVENGKKDDALECAERYESEGHILRSDLQASTLAIKFAKEICDQVPTQRSRNRLAKMVKFMDNPIDRVNYLKIAKKYLDAFNILCNERKFDEAYRLCAAQGWADDGLKLAEEKKNAKWVLQFTFQKAITGLVKDDKVDNSIIKRLHSLMNSDDDQIIKAKANLLLGKSDKDFFSCRRAFELYLPILNTAGCIEAFNLMIQFRIKGTSIGFRSTEIKLKQILDAYSKAAEAGQVLDNVLNHKPLSAAQEHALTLLEEFYGLQRQFSVADQNVYSLTPHQHIWVDLCSGCNAFHTDIDGMIQIDCTDALKVIRRHVQDVLLKWKEKDELQVHRLFQSHLSSFQFHKQLEDKGCVKKSFKMSYQRSKIYEYLRLCYTGIELSKFFDGEIKSSYVVQLLVNFFKPAAALYLGVTWGQMVDITKSSSASLLVQHSRKIVEKSDHDFHVDNWLDAWSILSILGKDHLDILLKQLHKCETQTKTLRIPANRMPAVYIYSKNDGGFVHVFSMWIRACFLIQSDKRIIASSKVVLHFFLETVIRQRSIRSTISVTSLVNILTIHTTALLTLTALCNFIQRKPSNVLIPNSYERVVNVFDNVGKQANRDSIRVLDACMNDEKVLKEFEKMKTNQHAVQNIQNEITRLLWQILDLLLGKHAYYFHPLRHAMKLEDCVKRGETRHCLLLVLILFGNLSEIDQQCTQIGLQIYHNLINDTFEVLKDSIGEESQILRKAYGMFSLSANTTGFFLAINHLITAVDSHDHIARMNIRQRPTWKWDLERAQMRHFPARPLLPTASKSAQLQKYQGHVMLGESDQLDTAIQMSLQAQSEDSSSPIERSASLQQAGESDFKSIVPSHPASAYLTNPTTNQSPQNVSTPDPLQNVGDETIFSGSLPTTHTSKQVLTSQTSIEPQEEEESRVSLEEVEDEDLKNVTLSAPIVLDRQTSETTAQQGNFAIVEDTSMMDEQFCRFCAVPLRADETLASVAEQDEGTAEEEQGDHEPVSEDQGEVKIELYASHCISEKHTNNMKAHENFITLKKEYYEPLKEKLGEVLQDLNRFESENVDSNLRVMIQEIEKELENDERTLKETWLSAQWKFGASQIEQHMYGRIDKLIFAAEDQLSKEQARVKLLREQAAAIQEEDHKDDENLSDEGEGSQSDEEISKKVNANDVKERERQRKRERKKQFKHRGSKR